MARSLLRWDPASEMLSLRSAMDRLLGESFVRPWSGQEPLFGREVLPLDLRDTGKEIVIEAAIPGVTPEEVDIQITGNVLTIKGERKEEKEEKEGTYIYREQSFGSFSRSVTLPTEVDVGRTKAEIQNGVLTLTLPKLEAVQPKSIKITAK